MQTNLYEGIRNNDIFSLNSIAQEVFYSCFFLCGNLDMVEVYDERSRPRRSTVNSLFEGRRIQCGWEQRRRHFSTVYVILQIDIPHRPFTRVLIVLGCQRNITRYFPS